MAHSTNYHYCLKTTLKSDSGSDPLLIFFKIGTSAPLRFRHKNKMQNPTPLRLWLKAPLYHAIASNKLKVFFFADKTFNDKYQNSLCECDKEAAECFLENRKTYQQDLFDINVEKYCKFRPFENVFAVRVFTCLLQFSSL